ncbi:MAG: hypothetical protein FJ387_28035 [Verrucomicrobia bacterium]|nr:hypothetical protein [Verrucomicrobiota bacterium]
MKTALPDLVLAAGAAIALLSQPNTSWAQARPSGPGPAGPPARTVFVTDTTINAGNVTYDGQTLTVSNCTLTVNGPHTFAGVELLGNAVLTHSAGQAGFEIQVSGDVAVSSDTTIDVSGKGYLSRQGPGAGQSPSRYGGSGAGYGGSGAAGWDVAGGGSYGSVVAPAHLGSGGGGSRDIADGGAGGGLIRLAVGGILSLEGTLRAAGANGGSGSSGGGSGGSIHLRVGTLRGSGSIQANGGSGGTEAGGGAGGRIALEYETNEFGGTISAQGGGGGRRAGAGTIYTKAAGAAYGSVLVDNGGNAGAITRLKTDYWPQGARFELTVSGAALVYPDEPMQFENLALESGGQMSHAAGQTDFQLTVPGNVSVPAGSAINANGRGHPNKQGPGAGQSGWFSGGSTGGGAGGGFGGTGGSGWKGTTGGSSYGSIVAPMDLGSGGGGTTDSWVVGGSGGGLIRLVVGGTLSVDGTLSANGTVPSVGSGGGGAGGSVYLTVGRLRGDGHILARGGDGEAARGGGGAGRSDCDRVWSE